MEAVLSEDNTTQEASLELDFNGIFFLQKARKLSVKTAKNRQSIKIEVIWTNTAKEISKNITISPIAD